MGKYLLEIKSRTIDDNVRTTVASAALDKYYHPNCLLSASRTVPGGQQYEVVVVVNHCFTVYVTFRHKWSFK